jgi:hypothetical protein
MADTRNKYLLASRSLVEKVINSTELEELPEECLWQSTKDVIKCLNGTLELHNLQQ